MLKLIQPQPRDPLAAERERASGELDRLAVVDARRVAAEAKLAEIDAALAALDRADRESVERWAETGTGELPAPLVAERRVLLARRLDAEAEHQAAKIAVDAVAAKRTALIEQLNAIGVKFRQRAVDGALVEARRLHAEAKSQAAEIGARLMRLEALRLTLVESQAAAVNQRNGALAAIFGDALSEVETLRPPEVMPDQATVARHAAEWREALQ